MQSVLGGIERTADARASYVPPATDLEGSLDAAHPVTPPRPPSRPVPQYIFHRVKAHVTGIPESPFSTVEVRPGGQLLTKWVWKAPPLQETF